ncbi:MAG TPA: hypothetical protein VFM93_13580 [Candidatus Limnocylindria bacterium]|nr:hypothetical protein [Candidatus Limnocylindria bacterium]
MSGPERVTSFVPIESFPLPPPLNRFGPAFPPALAESYVTAYTREGAAVLDPLAYPFSAADAVTAFGRRGVARGPQPLGEWACRAVAGAPAAGDILAVLERVAMSALTGMPHRIAMRELYASRCDTCRAPVVAEAFLWDRDAPAPSKKAFRCTVCARDGRSLLIEAVTDEDVDRARAVEPRGLSYWQFVDRFGPDEERRALGQTVAALFTSRNLAALVSTLRAVETAVTDPAARAVLLVALVEVLVGGSQLNALAGHGTALRVEKGRARRGNASQHREINVWLEYERTVRDLASWLDAHGARRPRATEDGPADLVLLHAPVDDTLGAWSYVATVLLLGADAARPLDASDARLSARERLLRATRSALLDAHRASRPEAPAVLYLSRADAGTLAACALGAAGAGYRLRGILYQRDALPSAYGGAAAILDLDRDAPLLVDQRPAGALAIEDAMRTGIRETVAARGSAISSDRAAAAALEGLASARLLAPLALARAGGVSELELFEDHFRSALADGRRAGIERVARGDDVSYALSTRDGDQAPLDDRVEWGVWTLLSSGRDVETRALLRHAYALFRGAETPDRELVERCLASYAVQSDGARWRLRDEDALASRHAEQTALAASLLAAGRRLGFRVHVGRELRRRRTADGALLADLVPDADRIVPISRALRGPADALDSFDVGWYDRGKMAFLWQLDWTARAHRSVVALGEAIPDDDRVFRFLAVADARQPLLAWKLERSPDVAEAIRRRGWRLVKWAPLARFAGDPAAGLADLEPVLGLEPAVERSGQQLVFNW